MCVKEGLHHFKCNSVKREANLNLRETQLYIGLENSLNPQEKINLLTDCKYISVVKHFCFRICFDLSRYYFIQLNLLQIQYNLLSYPAVIKLHMYKVLK